MSRREQIINAALEVFTTKGFAADFTMSSLAKKLDIGKSTIYEYFDNKDDIIKASIMQYLDNAFTKAKSMFDVDMDSFEASFKSQLSSLLYVASESRTLIETLSPGFFRKLPETVQQEVKSKMEKAREQLQKEFITIFYKASQEGLIPTDVSIEKSMVVTSLVVGSIMLFSDPRTTLDIAAFVDEIYNSALKILN